MGKKRLRFLCVPLILCLLLSGCYSELLRQFGNSLMAEYTTVPYSEMEYTRPNMAALEQTLEESCAVLRETDSMEAAEDAIYGFYDVYDRFYTDYYLANICYSRDLTDVYWVEEYNFCAENAPTVDAALEELYYTIADAPLRQQLEEELFGIGYFDSYEGESIWDEAFLSLLEQESALQAEYYDLSEQAQEAEYYSEAYFTTYGTQMAELFVRLIALRQEIAAYVGYDSYPQFAYDFYYYRDYTAAQAESYLREIGQILYEPYCRMNQSDIWEGSYEYCSESDTFSYVKQAASAMGGQVKEAFALLERAGLYDIGYGENKYPSSFETYLWSYYEPFIFMCPYLDQSDKLTFAHEFGHFCNDYVCRGSYAGTDIAEVHSQAFEYLSLCYSENTDYLTTYKLADSLCVYVEQAAYALFEQQVYGLTGEALTAENVLALYAQIGSDFGLDSWDWDSRDFVTVTHFYTNPMYMISYVVSNDLAMQIYQRELESAGAGLSLYEQILSSQDSFLLTFAETYGLQSPFAEGRLQDAAKLFTTTPELMAA